MGKRITEDQVVEWRRLYREGFSLVHIAGANGVSEATVKRHVAFNVDGKAVLPRAEVHIEGQRGRWMFTGGIGTTKAGEQYAEFRSVRTGRCRIFRTRLVTTVHRR